MRTSVCLAPALVLASFVACGDPPAGGASSASARGATTAPPVAASASPVVSAPVAASAAPAGSASAAAAPSEAPTLANMFAGPPEAGTKDSKPIAGSDGVVLALPEGWNGEDDDSNYHTQFRKKDLEVEKGVRGASVICGHFDSLDDKNSFKRMVYVDAVEKDVWEEPVEGKVGVGPYPAKVARGTGKQVSQPHERVAYYVHTTPPGGQGVLCVGSYPKSHPELEKAQEHEGEVEDDRSTAGDASGSRDG